MKTQDFTVTIDNEEKAFCVRSPSLEDQREAQKVYNTAFTDAITSNSVVRAKMDDVLEKQGLWNKEKQIKYQELQDELFHAEKRLAQGGFALKEAKELALKMKELRLEIRDLISVRTSLDNHSAEGQADNARFIFLVSACVVYKDNNNKRYFKDLADYMDKTDDPVALAGAQKLANILYNLDNNFEKNLPENKFLKKYRFVNDDLRLIDKQGRTIDSEGRLVDANSRFIDEEGNFVDKDGNRVDEKGEYIVDAQPFLDDDGNPVTLEEETKNNEAPSETETKSDDNSSE